MNEQNQNNQPPQKGQPILPQPPFISPQPMWRRSVGRYNYTYFSSHFATSGLVVGMAALTITLVAFSNNLMPAVYYLIYILELAFFYGGTQHYSHTWSRTSAKSFIKHIFWIGLLLRIPFTLYHHIDNVNAFGLLYYDNLADIDVYVGDPKDVVDGLLQRGDWNLFRYANYIAFDDLGAPILNTFLLLLTGNVNPCGVVLIFNVIIGAITPIFMYRIACRHFGEDVGRMTAILCMLNPNMIWWCCSLMKETQMVFFTCWFMERMDAVLMRGKLSVATVVPAALIGSYVFLYRAALGILIFLSFFAAVIFMSQRIVSYGKKISAGVLVAFVLLIGLGNQMSEYSRSLREQAAGDNQQVNMEWRSKRENGNLFAKYAGKAVFAPLIFTIPFPTLTYTHADQEALMEVAGGNIIKNVMSFLVILCMFMFLMTGEWRQHVFLIAYLIGYLIILAFSTYAQSGRFHMPAIPFEMMFAAYFIKIIQQNRKMTLGIGGKSTYTRWYNYWCIACVAMTVFWQWFKLKGQGII